MTAERAAAGAWRFAPSPFLRDVLTTVVTTGVTMASLVLTTRWIAAAFTTHEFGVYGISRRMVGTLAIYSNVVGLSLARYLALQTDEMVRRAHLVVAAGLALLPGILLLAAGALAPGFWAGLVFDDRTQGPALLSMLFLVLATASFNLLFAHYRGTNRVAIGNRFNVALVGIGPMLVALASASTGSTAVVNTLSAGVMLIALVVLAPEIWSAFRASGAALRAGCFREQWAFVWPRIPGGFAIGSLASVAPVLAPRFATTTAAGYLVAGQVLLRLVDAGTAAFGVVALPKVAELHARGQAAFIRARVGDVIAMAVHLGLFFTFHLLVWADVIVTAWLGDRYAPAVPVIRVVLCSVAPYTAYTLLRSVIDVLDERAVNARNTYAAFAMTVVAALALGYGGYGASGLAAASAAGMILLGALTVRYLWRALALDWPALHLGPGVAGAVGLGLLAAGARWVVPDAWPVLARLAVGGVVTGLLTLVYLYLLRRVGVRWVTEIEARLIRRPAAA